MGRYLEEHRLLRAALDAVPIPVFVIGRDFSLRDQNPAGEAFLGAVAGGALGRLCGEAVHCVNALAAPGGCGTSPACPECGLRGAVDAALARGAPVRRSWSLERSDGRGRRRQQLFVTAADLPAAGPAAALVVIEDFTEFTELRSLVPICAACKKIRDDRDYWEQVEHYLARHMDLTFTHGLCPECLEHYRAESRPRADKTRGGPGATGTQPPP